MLPLLAFIIALYAHRRIDKMTVEEKKISELSNGYQFRDVTFDTMADYIKHPDVVNNNFVASKKLWKDKGVFGIPREYSRLYDNLSQITVLHRTDSLYL